MRTPWLFAAIATTLFIAADKARTRRWDFEDATLGRLPNRWSSAKTGTGPGSVWKVVEDAFSSAGPKVLAQTSSEGPNPLFNLCVADDTHYTDVDLSVAIRPREGNKDQGGGLLWRYQDAANYYVARMNPLEDNFRLYKVVAGKRTQLATADIDAPAGTWHKLRVVHRGHHIQCYLNGKLYLNVKDDTFKTAGKIGLWTKADAVTSFDNLSVRPPPAD